jgi:hypothetical protein
MSKPDLQKIPAYYHKYVQLVTEENLQKAFQKHTSDIVSLLETIEDEKWNYRYAEGKWSIKEVVQHLIDGERIFCYRALRFARKDETPLPGFEENDYAINSRADRRTKEDLLDELKVVQASSALLFQSFDEEALQNSGIANDTSVSVEGLGYIIIGHTIHHKRILLERYL